ncbi:hypothetical protein PC123_g23128 [Phytophthora cactorum]|nr:hypothetical protein PC123_g23128 [Phytophthora cactorum]
MARRQRHVHHRCHGTEETVEGAKASRARIAITGSNSDESLGPRQPRKSRLLKKRKSKSYRVKTKTKRHRHGSRRRWLRDTGSSSSSASVTGESDNREAKSDDLFGSSDASGSAETNASTICDAGKDGGDVTAQDDLVSVPKLDVMTFDDWEELESYIKVYGRRTFQIYSVRTATPVSTRNQKIKDGRSFCDQIPANMKFYNKTYVCTHAGKPRQQPNGTSHRPNQYSRRIGCKAQINACVRKSNDWEVCITKQIVTRNHDVGTEVYQSYHEARQIDDAEVLSGVRTLYRGGANRKRILELESSWQTLKRLVDRSTALDECVVSILFWQMVNERAWARTINRVGVYVNVEYDDELNTLSNLVSRHAVELAKQHYDFALPPTTKYNLLSWALQCLAEANDDSTEEYMLNPKEWTCSCIFRAQTEKFKELQAVGKPIAEIGCQWGTKTNAALTSTLVEFVRVVKTGSCPVVRQPDGGADESINTPHKSDTNSNHRNESQDETGAHFETETGIFPDIGSEVKTTIADYADSGEGRRQLSVTGCAVMSFIDELDEGLPLSQLSEASTRDNPETEPRNDTVSPPQTVCETPAVPDTIADTEDNNEEVRSDDNVETTLEAAPDDDGEKEASAGGCGDEVTTRGASEETSSLTKP